MTRKTGGLHVTVPHGKMCQTLILRHQWHLRPWLPFHKTSALTKYVIHKTGMVVPCVRKSQHEIVWAPNIGQIWSHVENPGIDPGTSRMLSGRSTIWANSPLQPLLVKGSLNIAMTRLLVIHAPRFASPTFQFWFRQKRNATRRKKDLKPHLACVNYVPKWPTASLTHCHPVCQTWRFRDPIMNILRRMFAIRVSNLTRLLSLGKTPCFSSVV